MFEVVGFWVTLVTVVVVVSSPSAIVALDIELDGDEADAIVVVMIVPGDFVIVVTSAGDVSVDCVAAVVVVVSDDSVVVNSIVVASVAVPADDVINCDVVVVNSVVTSVCDIAGDVSVEFVAAVVVVVSDDVPADDVNFDVVIDISVVVVYVDVVVVNSVVAVYVDVSCAVLLLISSNLDTFCDVTSIAVAISVVESALFDDTSVIVNGVVLWFVSVEQFRWLSSV